MDIASLGSRISLLWSAMPIHRRPGRRYAMKKSATPLSKTDLDALKAAVGKVVPKATKSEKKGAFSVTYTR
jgi:hypothetical protein